MSFTAGPPPSAAPPPETSGTWVGVLIGLGALVLGCFFGGAVTAVLGASSESLGVRAAQLTVMPIGFGIAATLMALILRKNPNKGVSIGAPVGCGCMGAIGAAAMFFVFMVVIWPSL
ncbi:MAG: hypothetical protein AB8I08_02945 [Sandaracinaceae bacterium]